MSNRKKHRICEILGVEVGEEFEASVWVGGPFRINKNGELVINEKSVRNALTAIIENPEQIIRKQQFTTDDIELMRHIRAVFGMGALYRTEDGKLWFTDGDHTLELPKNILNCIKFIDGGVQMEQVLKEGVTDEKAKT